MSEPETDDAERVYIREAAKELNRRMGTLRKWEQTGILPEELLPFRGDRGWRYWTRPQLESLKLWIKDFNSPFTHVLDPNNKNLGIFYDASALPWNADTIVGSVLRRVMNPPAATAPAPICRT